MHVWNAGPDDVFDFGQRVSFLFTFPLLIYYVPTRISLRVPANTLRNGKVFSPWFDRSLSNAFDEPNSFGVTLFGVFTVLWPSTRRFSVGECSLPSPLKFVMECSATHAFWWHETNFFLCLTTSGLTHDVLQWVSFHPNSHWNLLRIAQRASDTLQECKGY